MEIVGLQVLRPELLFRHLVRHVLLVRLRREISAPSNKHLPDKEIQKYKWYLHLKDAGIGDEDLVNHVGVEGVTGLVAGLGGGLDVRDHVRREACGEDKYPVRYFTLIGDINI